MEEIVGIKRTSVTDSSVTGSPELNSCCAHDVTRRVTKMCIFGSSSQAYCDNAI